MNRYRIPFFEFLCLTVSAVCISASLIVWAIRQASADASSSEPKNVLVQPDGSAKFVTREVWQHEVPEEKRAEVRDGPHCGCSAKSCSQPCTTCCPVCRDNNPDPGCCHVR